MKMKFWTGTVILSTLTAFGFGAISAPSSAATIDLEAYKDNNVLRDSPDEANPATSPSSVLNVYTSGLAYMAFDLNSLPANSAITAASFGAVDLRTSRNQYVHVYLLDIPADWDENTFTFNTALANYGAALSGSNAIVDTSNALWQGQLDLHLDPSAEVLAFSYQPFTDQDLIDGLNAELTTGDGQAVMVFVGRSGTNNYVADRDHPDYTGPTLHLTYSVVPEPSTAALSALMLFGAAIVRRNNR